MKTLIITFGSHGDVQPYVALGLALQDAGHAVTICTAEQFQPFVQEHGLAYGYMNGELLKLVDTDAGRQAMEETTGLLGAAKSMIKLSRMATPLNKQMMIDSWQTAEQVQPDLVIFHPKALGGPSIAEKFGAAVFAAVLQPMVVPTAEFPLGGLPALPFGGWYNRLTYRSVPLGYRMYAKVINEVRQEQMDLPKLANPGDIFQTAAGQAIPILHGFSPHVVPRPADWPAHAHITGYWFLDRQAAYEPPAALAQFLDAAEPPVYLGFGSMAGKDPARLTRIIGDAIDRTGLRAIVATGWGGLQQENLPDTTFTVDKVPHDWLFPRVSAVIHHGGAGTTAAGLRAGRPTLVCPFMGDQPFWGARVHDLGAGPAPIPQKKLSSESLAAALYALTSDKQMRQKAAHIGEQIRAENGTAAAVRLIEHDNSN